MDLTQLKTQITTMFLMSNAQNKDKDKQDQSPYSAIWIMMYTMLFISAIEYLFKVLPVIGLFIKQQAVSYASNKNNFTNLVTSINTNHEEHSITLLRTYDDKHQTTVTVEKVDSIINYLTKIDNSRHIKIHNRYILNSKDIINVCPGIKAKVININMKDNNLDYIEIKLFSDSLKISQLNKWIDDVYEKYCIEKRNNLGNKRFYFNEHPVEPMRELDTNNTGVIKYRWESAPKYLTFHINEFSTSKSLSNVFGEHISELKERVNLFLNHPEWYHKRGIPYSLGILLHGLPGCGKTSTIKAIAKDTNRHLINLSLKRFTTQRQLLDLFQNEILHVLAPDGSAITYSIPLDQRIYVIEDIDCLSEIVKQRTPDSSPKSDDPSLNLSFLLNLLDGVLETPGRILIITTNHVDMLDKALIRPGRIDVNIRFDLSKRELILDMINNFYSSNLTINDIPESLEKVFTPAEVIESLCLNYNNYRNGLQHLINRAKVIEENTMIKMIADETNNHAELPEFTMYEHNDYPENYKAEFLHLSIDPDFASFKFTIKNIKDLESNSDNLPVFIFKYKDVSVKYCGSFIKDDFMRFLAIQCYDHTKTFLDDKVRDRFATSSKPEVNIPKRLEVIAENRTNQFNKRLEELNEERNQPSSVLNENGTIPEEWKYLASKDPEFNKVFQNRDNLSSTEYTDAFVNAKSRMFHIKQEVINNRNNELFTSFLTGNNKCSQELDLSFAPLDVNTPNLGGYTAIGSNAGFAGAGSDYASLDMAFSSSLLH